MEDTQFYDKTAVFPGKKYYYRIKIQPDGILSVIEETDVYLQGIKDQKIDEASRLISLIQQNKHLHSICLNDDEGRFLIRTFGNYGKQKPVYRYRQSSLNTNRIKIDPNYLAVKNRIEKRLAFSSECDLESFILLNLKDKTSLTFKQVSKILADFSENSLRASEIYNQFVIGNAYSADIIILNSCNINIFELKKDALNAKMLPTLRKELKKYYYYSLFSPRFRSNQTKSLNLFVLVLKGSTQKFIKNLYLEFNEATKTLGNLRRNNLTVLEYSIRDKQLFIEKVKETPLS